jgi:transketolase
MVDAMKNPFNLSFLDIEEKCREIRIKIIHMNSNAGAGHTGGDLSETDILATLYFNILQYNPENLQDPDRDRFILSKGHGVGGFYCTLAEAGLIDESLLDTYLAFDSLLPGHPVKQKIKFVEINTGALGHGLSVGVGLALSAKLKKRQSRVFVLTGDGELQEGSNWEAALSAAQYGLDNLVVIVDRNKLQLADRVENIVGLEPLADKWRAFGFDVHETEGNNIAKIIETVENLDYACGKPHVIIAHTIKGYGISFIQDRPAWHHRVPTEEEVARAVAELDQ